MRTTSTLDDDAITIAREQAAESGMTLEQAVSFLIPRGAAASREPVVYPGDFQPFPERPDEHLITLEHVNRLRDELP